MKQNKHAMKIILTIALLLVAIGVKATLTTQTFTITTPSVNGVIPDGNPAGANFQGLFNLASTGDLIGGVTVGLNISGGYNGDLYAYLIAPNGTMVVLMNQPGADSVFGADGAGMNITLVSGTSDNGSIQTAGSGYLTGSYNVPGNNLNNFGTTASPGGPANGTWTLFFADMSSGGGTAQLDSWSVGISLVPEPVPMALGVFATLLVMLAGVKRMRQIRNDLRSSTDS
jgi:subtilisin-like proprotein convertase family protein